MKVHVMQPFKEFVKYPPNIPDLGLGYIVSALKKHGHDVTIMDWNMNLTVSGFKKWLVDNAPQCVGVKLFTKDVGAAKETVKIVRETLPEAFIVIGGPHPSSTEPGELMSDFSICDYAIKGEAEQSFPLLLSAINGKSRHVGLEHAVASAIPGLTWRSNTGVCANPISLHTGLDDIDFPDWDMINPMNYFATIHGSDKSVGVPAPVITTRGCTGKCSFCDVHNISGRKIRFRSPENVFKELCFLYDNYNVRSFMFQDNSFTSIKNNLVKLCQLMVDSDMKVEWDCVSYERLDNLTPEVLSLMYKSGCRMIHLGIESGSEQTRKVMNKHGSLEMINEKIRLIAESGIEPFAWFILGFPGESRAQMQQTIKFAFSAGTPLVKFNLCFPLPGTDVYYYIKNKYKFDTIDWGNFDIYKSPYPVSELTSKQLTRLYQIVRWRSLAGRGLRELKNKIFGKKNMA
ncbi:MAG: radical SAM protein [Nitrospirae bacterium YQR-1]